MKLIYSTVFFNEKYINLINLLLKSYKFFGNASDNIDYLIICNPDFKKKIQAIFNNLKINGKIWCLDLSTKFEACWSRYKIFNYPNIKLYNKILYLDCDILITNSINKVLDLQLENILYALQEGNTNHEYWGKYHFKNNNPNCSAFTSGILLFNNHSSIKNLFNITLNHISDHINNNLSITDCLDQPFIVYNAINNNLYNNTKLNTFVINNPNLKTGNVLEVYREFTNQSICHFPGVPGLYLSKYNKIKNFLNYMFRIYKKNNIPKILLINKLKTPCIKNNTFPLIGICVSYKYMDTLKFMLPVNYNHFERIYLITQKDDIDTINFCKKFNNVVVIFYEFNNNGKQFDKYGALNMVQKIVYEKYPKHWYLIIDSDIILPNNFINILQKNKLNESCLYGAMRNNYNRSSELLNEIIPAHDWEWNNILHNDYHHRYTCILGCFQLYFKKDIYHKNIFNNAGFGDFEFCWDNFNLFCQLEDVVYLHIGESGENWDGKKTYFIDNINIDLDQIYFQCNIKCKNIYYDLYKNIVNIENSDNSYSKNIHEDIWTCSNEFREDIKDFFKDKSHYTIAEIGSHKGYSTRYLSGIFKKVYAVDNSVEWTNFNKNLNSDKSNIEYIHLDIYKDSWNIIPDVDVVFIDASHQYKYCKSDFENSMKQFTNLKYVIFDDYGVWPGVKQLVNEKLNQEIISFEKFIGINNIPGPNKIVKNSYEGIICKINIQVNPLLNKVYTWGNIKDTIKFLENNTLDSFGKGKYKFLDKYLVRATFGGREHLLKFNEKYDKFISMRNKDFCIVYGSIVNINYTGDVISIKETFNPIADKAYDWGNIKNAIKFLDNGMMNAFGKGTYIFIDLYQVKAKFGGREHLIKFNSNYNTFVSTRNKDNFIVYGKLSENI